jgi:hypothetical protein
MSESGFAPRFTPIPCHSAAFLLRIQLIQNAVSDSPGLNPYLLSFLYHALRQEIEYVHNYRNPQKTILNLIELRE